MSKLAPLLLILVLSLGGVQQVLAKETGKTAAMKYFTKGAKKQMATRAPASAPVASGQTRMLGISVGSLLNSRSYHWSEESFRGYNVEASYFSQGTGIFGRGLSLEMQKFAADDEELTKMAFLFNFTFPRRITFPVYLGAAFGPGYFFKQLEDESEFTIDYKAYLGLRLNQVNSQYFLQSGVKNHVHVLSDGQFIGWYISSGVAYKF